MAQGHTQRRWAEISPAVSTPEPARGPPTVLTSPFCSEEGNHGAESGQT